VIVDDLMMVREPPPSGVQAGKKSVACFCGSVIWLIAVLLVVFQCLIRCFACLRVGDGSRVSLSEGQDLA
jgi:hypothetical protein